MMERNYKTICDKNRIDKSNISLICKMVLLIFLGFIFLPLANASDVKIFSNHNTRAVQNLKTTTFKLTRPMFITSIETYHWNDQKGTPPGKIGIRYVGLWQAKGSPGMHNTQNAYWTVYPNIRLEPGIYAITDSDPATWSQNSGTGGLGFVDVFGKSIEGFSSTSPQPTATSKSPDEIKGDLPPAEITITDGNTSGVFAEKGVLKGKLYVVKQKNGTYSEYAIKRFDKNSVHLSRLDIKGSSAGLRGEYIGKLTGNRAAEGTATWTWERWAEPFKGTWKASW